MTNAFVVKPFIK